MSSELIDRSLEAISSDCRYLQQAVLEAEPDHLVARGRFGIPASCYIDDTGHLNSVEFKLCFNQLIEVLLVQALSLGLSPELPARRPETRIRALRSVFRRVIDGRRFEGELRAPRDLKIGASHTVLCRFWDDNDGLAEGEVTIDLV
ncbi:MAG: FcoT family thioesterase [Planctomycetota bacterium]